MGKRKYKRKFDPICERCEKPILKYVADMAVMFRVRGMSVCSECRDELLSFPNTGRTPMDQIVHDVTYCIELRKHKKIYNEAT